MAPLKKNNKKKPERFPDRSENPTILDVEESMRRHYEVHPEVPLAAIIIDIKMHDCLRLLGFVSLETSGSKKKN